MYFKFVWKLDIEKVHFWYIPVFYAKAENYLSYKEVRGLGPANVPAADALSDRSWTREVGVNICVIYSGLRSFRALYVRVALL